MNGQKPAFTRVADQRHRWRRPKIYNCVAWIRGGKFASEAIVEHRTHNWRRISIGNRIRNGLLYIDRGTDCSKCSRQNKRRRNEIVRKGLKYTHADLHPAPTRVGTGNVGQTPVTAHFRAPPKRTAGAVTSRARRRSRVSALGPPN